MGRLPFIVIPNFHNESWSAPRLVCKMQIEPVFIIIANFHTFQTLLMQILDTSVDMLTILHQITTEKKKSVL